MLEPKAASSISLPCSAISLHCEHPWVQACCEKTTIAAKKRKTFFFMLQRYEINGKLKMENLAHVSTFGRGPRGRTIEALIISIFHSK